MSLISNTLLNENEYILYRTFSMVKNEKDHKVWFVKTNQGRFLRIELLGYQLIISTKERSSENDTLIFSRHLKFMPTSFSALEIILYREGFDMRQK